MKYNCVSDTEKIQYRENTKKGELGESMSHVLHFFLFPQQKTKPNFFPSPAQIKPSLIWGILPPKYHTIMVQNIMVQTTGSPIR